jgi:hypothetical protein
MLAVIIAGLGVRKGCSIVCHTLMSHIQGRQPALRVTRTPLRVFFRELAICNRESRYLWQAAFGRKPGLVSFTGARSDRHGGGIGCSLSANQSETSPATQARRLPRLTERGTEGLSPLAGSRDAFFEHVFAEQAGPLRQDSHGSACRHARNAPRATKQCGSVLVLRIATPSWQAAELVQEPASDARSHGDGW